MPQTNRSPAGANGWASGNAFTDLNNSRNSESQPQTQDSNANGFYRPKPIKRFRRGKADMADIRRAIIKLLEEDHPQTVRQVFYALTVRGLIQKNESEYKQTI